MRFSQDLNSTLFFFGFQECKRKKNINFLKLTDNDYIIIKVFEKVETADLFYIRINEKDSICDSKPIKEETLKLSFSPNSDNQIIKDYIEKFKSLTD